MWRNSSLIIRVFMFDGRLVFFWILALFPMALWKVGLAAIATTIFYIVEARGFTLGSALRRIRRNFAGRKGKALPATEYRRYG